MDLLKVRTLPFPARRNYFYEIRHIIPWSFTAGLIEGYFASVVVAKSFHGSERLIAIASATPAAAYLFSLFWGMLCVGRPKIRLFAMLAAGTALLAATLGAIPTTRFGAIWFVAQMAAAQVLMAGVVTVRSAVWKSNYPQSHRGRITARLEALRFVISITTVMTAAHLCDRNPEAFRYIYPIAGCLGLCGAYLLKNIRVRGERGEIARQKNDITKVSRDYPLTEPFSLTALLSPSHVFRQMLLVLRNDRRFKNYCIAQSFTGVANLMTIPVVAMVVAYHLELGNRWGFWISTAVLQVLPQIARLGSIGRWATLFDRVGVVQFRVVNVSCWVLSLVFGLLATLVVLNSEYFGPTYLLLAIVLFILRGLGSGIAHGGGTIAWTIGHLHFAPPDQAELYMGVHVFLTGLRGILSPMIGIALFELTGSFVWAVSLFFSLVSLLLFIRMARIEPTHSTVPE